MALIAVVLGLIAAVAWGVGDYAGARTSKRFGGVAATVVVNIVGALMIDIVYLLWFRSHTTFDAVGWMLAVGSSLAFVSANLSFYKGLEYGPVSIVSPVGSMYPVVTTVLLVLLFGAHLSTRQVGGIAIVMLGVAAASGLFEHVQQGKRFSRGPLLGLSTAICWGVAWVCMDRAVGRLGWQLSSALELSAGALLLLLLLPYLRHLEPSMAKQLPLGLRAPVALFAGALTTFGFLVLSVGVERVGDLVTVAIVISACYPIITVFLALRHLKEAFQPIPLAGALMGIAGIVVLALG